MPDERLRQLMVELYDAHRSFRAEWNATGGTSPEPESITKARDRFWAALGRLFDERLDSLRENFASGHADATDSVIDFLEIDVPAFRCGYEKEKYLRKLKSVSLNEAQRARLKQTALALVSKGNFRRELVEWSRLMIVLADPQFMATLRDTIRTLDTGRARGAERMLRSVLGSRPDLRTSD